VCANIRDLATIDEKMSREGVEVGEWRRRRVRKAIKIKKRA